MDMGLKLKNRKVLFLGKLYIYFEEIVIAINENLTSHIELALY